MFDEANYRKAIFALAKAVRNGLWQGPFEARVRALARSFDVPRRAVRRDVWALLGRYGSKANAQGGPTGHENGPGNTNTPGSQAALPASEPCTPDKPAEHTTGSGQVEA